MYSVGQIGNKKKQMLSATATLCAKRTMESKTVLKSNLEYYESSGVVAFEQAASFIKSLIELLHPQIELK